ncbi:MAG: 1,4-alpha-glucan branching protein GlgB [Oscillospiraceae bacterium]|nr:1,4-alpha-glucan branching protein GlgB [Oscillospiraceae bacterium]
MNLKKFYMGESFDAYEYFGAHLEDGGVVFRTYAPNAQRIAVTGQFNGWTEEPLTQMHQSGVWTGFAKDATPGQMYKYVVYGKNGRVEHCDPYGFGMELRPGAGSIIRDLAEYKFTDEKWIKKRTRCYDKPLNIYELHMGSWKMKDGKWHHYNEIADELIAYLKEYGYNYVEFMPLSEHPFDGSWGYQNTGFFAPTSRYGTAAQLMELIDKLHNAGIGAIMDFVPVHFAVDAYGLKEYDGTALYEYPHKDVGESEWGSYNFIHSRREVACFLQSAANYWLKEYHFDGLRMDAVSRLIYWQGDEKRGENGVTINFLKIMNQGLHRLHPTAMLIAEDSTAYPGVTKDVEKGGLGFDYKWDLGWMHDTLKYFECHPYDRANMSEKITFSIYYAYNERYILPFSHDEVVHGKKTIIDKLRGSYEQKFAQARLLYLYMMTHPGKKLNFMGNELAMFREWDERREPDWDLLKMPAHDSFHCYIGELNRLYLKKKAIWALDHTYDGFKWVDCKSDNKCVFGYTRTDGNQTLLVLFNFSDKEATIAPELEGKATMLLNTDWEAFGGRTKRTIYKTIPDTIPAFTGMMFSYTI